MGASIGTFPVIDSQWAGVMAAIDVVGVHFTKRTRRVNFASIVSTLFGPQGANPLPISEVAEVEDDSSDYFFVTWINYEAPGLRLLWQRSAQDAIVGAVRLASFVEAMRLEGSERIILHGFSYGSVVVTTTARALSAAGSAPVSRIIIAGSPGSAFQTADQVGMRPTAIINFNGYADLVSTRSLGYPPDDVLLSTTISARAIVGAAGLFVGHSNPARDLRKRDRVERHLEQRAVTQDAQEEFEYDLQYSASRSVLFQYAWLVAAKDPSEVTELMPARRHEIVGLFAALPRRVIRPALTFLNSGKRVSNLGRYDEEFGSLPTPGRSSAPTPPDLS